MIDEGYEMSTVARVRHTLWLVVADLLALFVYALILGVLAWH